MRVNAETRALPDRGVLRRSPTIQQHRKRIRQHVGAGGRQQAHATDNVSPIDTQQISRRQGVLAAVWHAATTTPRDRKELLRALLEEVIIKVERDKAAAQLTLRWKGGALNEIDLALPRSRPATIRTDEDTIALVRRLAVHYPDTVIAGILNRQGRTTVYGHRFEAGRVGNLRRYWDIPCFEAGPSSTRGELASIKKAAVVLGVAPSTLHRWLNDGIIPGAQLMPGAPWRIRLTDDLIARFSETAGDGF